MKQICTEFERIAPLRKFVRVLVGSNPRAANVYSCVDHDEISPKLSKYHERLSGMRSNEFPRMINVNLRANEVVKNAIETQGGRDIEKLGQQKRVRAGLHTP